MSQPQFDVIVFDLGGVLIELTGVAQMIAWTGIESDEELWRRWLTSPSVRGFETGRLAADEFAAAMCLEFALPVGAAEFMAEFALWPRHVFPGGHELLGALAARHRLAALSNNNAVHWERISRDMGLGGYFSASFLSHEIGLIKPDREVFEHVAEALGCAPGRILFLDDNRLNVEQAASVGMVAHRVAGVEQTAALLVSLGLLDGEREGGFEVHGSKV
ncbi:MAG: HAD-IA family hydrolase [Chloroflexia bacterium]